MLTDLEKNAIRDYYKKIAENLDGFRPRLSQRKMLAEIANVFSRTLDEIDEGETVSREGESLAVIEGPTGVGKSLAYLLAGSVMAQARGKKLVVSSATIALQEQLISKDLPFLIEKSGLHLTYALAKGRRRYLCPYRLYQMTYDHAQDDLLGFDHTFAVWQKKPQPEDISLLRELADAFASRKFNGDRDTWSDVIPDHLWLPVTNDMHGCLKAACPNKSECPFYLARETLEQVDVVVVNHDLLLADIGMGGGVILPAPGNSFYCIDEAHHLSKKALNQFAAEHSLLQATWLLEKLPQLSAKIASVTDKSELVSQTDEAALALAESLSEWQWFLNDVPELAITNENLEPVWLWEDGMIPPDLEVPTHNCAIAARQLVKHLQSLSLALASVRKDQSSESVLIDKLNSDLGLIVSRVEEINAVWDLFAEVPKTEEPPLAKWITRQNKEQNDYFFSASPVSAAAHLANGLWRRAAGAVLTSATLQSLGSFDLLLSQTGLKWFPKTSTLALDSPFDFENQGELYLPPLVCSPKDVAGHTREIIDWLPKLIDLEQKAGTLVLFSSRKQMQDVATGLPEDYQERLLIQGEIPKAVLIQTHLQNIQQNQVSIIFGLDSFAEGLDLPGETCLQVIIAKLPFAMPDNPIDKTMSRWIERRGGNPFIEITVPETSLKLIQAVGRLIRNESDFGRVTILDNRLQYSSYGKKLLASLPPFKRI